MIPIEVLRRVKVIYCHGGCPDGLAGAMILRDAYRMLGMYPKIEFVTYGTEAYKNAFPRSDSNEVALYCDIAPHRSVSAGLEAQVIDVDQFIILDHHKGAKGETEHLVKSFGERGVFADEVLEPGVSGATLAWREVWAPIEAEWDKELGPGEYSSRKKVQDFAECCGARDTWHTASPKFQRGQWISKMLMSRPPDYWMSAVNVSLQGVNLVYHPPYLSDEQTAMGRALFEAHEESVRQAKGNCIFQYIGEVAPDGSDLNIQGGLYVFQDNGAGFRLTSDVAESMRQSWEKVDSDTGKDLAEILKMKEFLVLMEKKCPVVLAGFYYTKAENKQQLTYSLRTIRGELDVAELAAFCGGGGHSKAAGFEVKPGQPAGDVLNAPQEHMRNMLTLFLAKKEKEKS